MSFTQLLQADSPLTASDALTTQTSSFVPTDTLSSPLQTSIIPTSQAFRASSVPISGHGDTIATATNLGTLTGSYTTAGAIDYNGDVDFFRFHLNSASNLNIALTKLTADADVQLLNSAGQVLASSTNSGSISDSINRATLAAGDYYVKISPFTTTNLTKYQLSLSTTSVSNLVAAESNIGTLNGTRVFSNWVGSTDTLDIYSFNLSTAHSLNMTLSGLSSDADIRLIRDANGNGIIDSTDVLQSSAKSSSNAEWINTTLGAGNYFVQVFQFSGDTNYNFTISTGDWYSSNLTDAGVIGQARTFGQDGSLSRTDMMSIMRETRDSGTIDATEVTDLRRIVSSLGYMMPDSVRVLSNKVVNSDPANPRSGIGNLFAGSSSTQMDSLINKWFLGGDRPTATGTYRYASGSLFQGGISYTDVDQGILGDCYLLASLSTVAQRSPNTISNMFTDNGDGTFIVRLYNNGVADYVTVDRYLPVDSRRHFIYDGRDSGRLYNDSNNELWVALAEKAYAQMNESGRLGQGVIENSYASIDGGNSGAVLRQITGLNTTSNGLNTPTGRLDLLAKVNAGKMVVLNTFDVVPVGSSLAGDHAYAVTGYNSSTNRFTLQNPWGSGAEISYNDLAANCQWWDAIG